VELPAEPELVDERQQIAIGAADEVVEALDRVALEAKGAGQAAEVGSRLEQDDVVTGSRQIVAGGQPGQPTADDDDALAFRNAPVLFRSPAVGRSSNGEITILRVRRGIAPRKILKVDT
jgi:hypothetical protein